MLSYIITTLSEICACAVHHIGVTFAEIPERAGPLRVYGPFIQPL